MTTQIRNAPAGGPQLHDAPAGGQLHPAQLAAIRAAAQDIMNDPAGQKGQDEKIAAAVKAGLDELRSALTSDTRAVKDQVEALAIKVGQPVRSNDDPAPVQSWASFVRSKLDAAKMKDRLRSGENFGLEKFSGQSFAASLRSGDEEALIDTTLIPGMIPKGHDLSFRPEGRLMKRFYMAAPNTSENVDDITYNRETEQSRLASISTVTTSAYSSGDSVIAVDDAAGLFPAQVLRIHAAGGILTKTIQSISGKNVTLTATLGASVADGVVITSETYGPTAENGIPPYTLLKTTPVTATMHGYKVAAQFSRKANVYAEILRTLQSRLPARQIENLSYILLYGGKDAAGTITTPGLLNTTGVQTVLWSTGDAGDTRADAVLRTWAACLGVSSPVVYMTKLDWLKMVKAKGASDGHYVMTSWGPIPIVFSADGPSLGGFLPIRLEDTLASGDFCVIDHAQTHEVVENPQLSGFEMGYVNDGMLTEIITVKQSVHLLHKIYRFLGYALGQWNSAPSA